MTEALATPRVAALPVGVGHTGRVAAQWTFGRKFERWLLDQGISLTAWAKRHGFPQSTLQAWVSKPNRKVPARAMARIAAITGLPVSYWTDDKAKYPPPAEYLDYLAQVIEATKALSHETLVELLPVLLSPEETQRLLAIRRAARQ